MLEGAKPNAGWLGPEMSGEDGATFKEKLHWAIGEVSCPSHHLTILPSYCPTVLPSYLASPSCHLAILVSYCLTSSPSYHLTILPTCYLTILPSCHLTSQAKARFGIDDKKPLGAYYDQELLQVDEMNNMQILLYGSLATSDDDILPGHIWVEREALEVQNMKYYCPTMHKASLQEQQKLIESYHGLDDGTLKPQPQPNPNLTPNPNPTLTRHAQDARGDCKAAHEPRRNQRQARPGHRAALLLTTHYPPRSCTCCFTANYLLLTALLHYCLLLTTYLLTHLLL